VPWEMVGDIYIYNYLGEGYNSLLYIYITNGGIYIYIYITNGIYEYLCIYICKNN
jgi:hypothetical protein